MKDFEGVTIHFEIGGRAFNVDQLAALESMTEPVKVCVDDGVTRMGEWGPETDYDKLRNYLAHYAGDLGISWTHRRTGQVDGFGDPSHSISVRCCDGDYLVEFVIDEVVNMESWSTLAGLPLVILALQRAFRCYCATIDEASGDSR